MHGEVIRTIRSLTSLYTSEPEKSSRTQILNSHEFGNLLNSRAFSMTDFGKKRKRNDEGAPKPNKKIAIQAPQLVKNVSASVVEGTGDWAPIVGSQAQTPNLLQSEELYSSLKTSST